MYYLKKSEKKITSGTNPPESLIICLHQRFVLLIKYLIFTTADELGNLDESPVIKQSFDHTTLHLFMNVT